METAATASLSSIDIIKLVISTGIFTALINQGINWYRDWRREKESNVRSAQYFALRVAVDMEAFAITCAEAIGDSDLHENSNGHAGQWHSEIPHLLSCPHEIDWKLIETSLCARILVFPNELKLRQSQLDSVWEFACEDFHDSFRLQTGISGYYAWTLAFDLRKFYKLPAFEPKQISWDIGAFLKEINDKSYERLETED